MSLAISFPVSPLNTTGNSSPVNYSLGAFTPSAGSLLVLFVIHDESNANLVGTVTGGGLTWTKREEVADSNGTIASLWTAPVGGSPASTTINYAGSDDATGCHMAVAEVTGQHASPIVQTKSATGSAANPSLSLSQAMNTNNAYLLGATASRNPAAITHPTGWTEQYDQGHSNPTSGFELSYRVNGETGSTIGVTSSSSVYSMLFIEIAVAGSAYTLTGAAGSFAETGNAATLKAARRLSASVGAFAETANAALLRWGRTIACAKGTFTLTGNGATLANGLRLVATTRAYFVSMIGAQLPAGWKLSAACGTFIATGQAATLRFGKGIINAVATYVATGNAAALRMAFRMTASKGTFNEAGQAAGLRYPYRLQCSAGSYSESGKPAGLKGAFKLAAAKGTFTETGKAAGLQKTFPIVAAKGTFVLSGKPASSIHTFRLDARPGRFVIVAPANLHPEAGVVLEATGGCILRDTGAGFVVRTTGDFVIRP